MALVRKNIQMSEEIAEYFETKSAELGVSQSSLMTIALKEYIDKEKISKMMEESKNMMNMLQDMVNKAQNMQKYKP